MAELSKRQKRVLRELLRRAYRAELGMELAKLLVEFQRWKAGEIEPGDVAHAIHEFHDGPNRELSRLYDELDLRLAVARAIALDLVDRSAVPAEVLADLEPLIDFARDYT